MDANELKKIIEAALMVADDPLTVDALVKLFADDGDVVTKEKVVAALDEITLDYAERGVELKRVASGYRFQARENYSNWVNRVWDERPPRYSRALIETLAIIAYRQPVTRGEIEAIRGVAVSSNIIRTLIEREWIKVAGHRDVPGRPAVFVTTKDFLDYFNLSNLKELPPLPEIRDIRDITPELFPDEPPPETVLDIDTEEDPQVTINYVGDDDADDLDDYDEDEDVDDDDPRASVVESDEDVLAAVSPSRDDG